MTKLIVLFALMAVNWGILTALNSDIEWLQIVGLAVAMVEASLGMFLILLALESRERP